MSEDSGFLGIAVTLYNKHRVKKALKKIQSENLANQGITYYQPSQIEAFFDPSEPFGNMMFSGGLNIVRSRAIARATECALMQGYSVIVMHCGNQELENALASYLGSQYVCAINRGNPIYDPFYGLTNQEISRLILGSTAKGFEINPVGKYYIDGISDFIRSKGIQPYCWMYITCPHLTLIDKINDAEATGKLSSNTARLIITQIMQGEIERGNIENYFVKLAAQGSNIIAQKAQLKYAMNASVAAQRKQVFSVDIQNSTSSLLINLLLSEAEMLNSNGRKVMIVADNIQISDNNTLQSLIKRSSSNCSIILSSDDVFASFSGEENTFFSFAGKCSKVILSKHASAYSCKKWSDYIGEYDKREISTTFSQNSTFVSHWGFGADNSSSVSVKRENIIKPEEFQRMQVNEVLIQNKQTGEISLVQIV